MHGRFTESARVLRRAGRLGAKRLVFDNGLHTTADGRLDCFDYCPNPTIRNGQFVPVCLADYAAAP
jgi:hypothetical protein